MKTNYQNCKEQLKLESIELKKHFPNDKPAVNMGINDFTDYLCRECDLTEHKKHLLDLYACKLHLK